MTQKDSPVHQRPETAQEALDGFIDRYKPEVAALGRALLGRLRDIIPPCVEMVYDNYNGLVVGFSPDEKASNAVISLLFVPRHVSMCLLQGAGLDDPHGLLEGQGNVVRHIKLRTVEDFDRPGVRELVDLALVTAKKPILSGGQTTLVIKSVSAKQRPRRPAGSP